MLLFFFFLATVAVSGQFYNDPNDDLLNELDRPGEYLTLGNNLQTTQKQ